MNEQKKGSVVRPAAPNRQVAATQQGDFVRGVVTELRRVTWPTRDEWVSATVLTIGLVVGIGIFTFVVDWAFGQLFALIHPV